MFSQRTEILTQRSPWLRPLMYPGKNGHQMGLKTDVSLLSRKYAVQRVSGRVYNKITVVYSGILDRWRDQKQSCI